VDFADFLNFVVDFLEFLLLQLKMVRSRITKRSGSESSQDSLSLPPPSPADPMMSFSSDPLLSLGPDPILSPLSLPQDSFLPTVLNSPTIMVSVISSTKTCFGIKIHLATLKLSLFYNDWFWGCYLVVWCASFVWRATEQYGTLSTRKTRNLFLKIKFGLFHTEYSCVFHVYVYTLFQKNFLLFLHNWRSNKVRVRKYWSGISNLLSKEIRL